MKSYLRGKQKVLTAVSLVGVVAAVILWVTHVAGADTVPIDARELVLSATWIRK